MKKFLVLLIAVSFVAACATPKKPEFPTRPVDEPVNNQAVRVVEQPPKVIPDPYPVPLPGQLKPIPANLISGEAEARIKEMMAKSRIEAPRTPEGYFNAITKYDYVEGALYQILCCPLNSTDIMLEPGEQLVDHTAGDTVRFAVKATYSGSEKGKCVHYSIKPLYPNIKTNVTLYTDRRTYYMEITSTADVYMAGVSWNYPMSDSLALVALQAPKTAPVQEPADEKFTEIVLNDVDPTKMNFHYEIHGDNPKWRPIRVFDDGLKTYIQFPESIKAYEAPVLFVLDSKKKLQLVNYRVKGCYYIVDRLFDQADLRMGQKDQTIVRIIKLKEVQS